MKQSPKTIHINDRLYDLLKRKAGERGVTAQLLANVGLSAFLRRKNFVLRVPAKSISENNYKEIDR